VAIGKALCGEFVLVQKAAESVASTNATVALPCADRNRLQDRRLLLERAVRSMGVVVCDVLAQHAFEMPLRKDQDPVEALAPDAADPALRLRLRLWRTIGVELL
jgi:hypothetical protein